jgi:hypothetical protein
MSPLDRSLTERSWRAPRSDGGRLIDPPWDQLESILAANRQLAAAADFELLGQRRSVFQAAARRELGELARSYTLPYRSVTLPPVAPETGPLILAAHQPELFHPGVWFKNFALGRMAQQVGGWAINLLIDNDVLQTPAIRVLAGTSESPHGVRVPFDRQTVAMPYEERPLLDAATFASFAERVGHTVSTWIADPLVHALWAHAKRLVGEPKRLGAILAQARHQLEADWGVQTLEVPLSSLCRGETFRRFVGELIVALPRFARIYNESLGEYRRLNRIRSRTHPVPELGQTGDWLEAPFWIWTCDEPERRRLFVRPNAAGWQLSDQRQVWSLTMRSDRADEALIVQLGDLEQRGVKVRPRALTTTLFARLCLGDLFIHGIGGAKYDQLTDQIMRRFWKITPPAYYAISATVWLPVPRPVPPAPQRKAWQETQRSLTFHAERFLAENHDAEGWIEQKRQWIRNTDPTQQRERHFALQRINHALQSFVAPLHLQAQQQFTRLLREEQRWKVLTSREYAFCLFPESTLRPFLLDI